MIMDIKQYIASGILEEYCMGLLNNVDEEYVTRMSLVYPEIKDELIAIEFALENFASLNAITPVHDLKNKIFRTLGLETSFPALDVNNMPLTNSEANHLQWLDALKHLIPEEPDTDFYAVPITRKPGVEQTLIVIKHDVPEETHTNVIESFFILKGQCMCTVGNQMHHLRPGDFLEIPLDVDHDIQMLSPYVVGILQHVAV